MRETSRRPRASLVLVGVLGCFRLTSAGAARVGAGPIPGYLLCVFVLVCVSGARVLVVWWIACKTFVQCLRVDSDDVYC